MVPSPAGQEVGKVVAELQPDLGPHVGPGKAPAGAGPDDDLIEGVEAGLAPDAVVGEVLSGAARPDLVGGERPLHPELVEGVAVRDPRVGADNRAPGDVLGEAGALQPGAAGADVLLPLILLRVANHHGGVGTERVVEAQHVHLPVVVARERAFFCRQHATGVHGEEVVQLGALVGEEEVGRVLDDRATQAAPELVALEGRLLVLEFPEGVERLVAQIEEGASPQRVRPGLRDRGEEAAAREPLFGLVERLGDLELRDRVHGKVLARLPLFRPGVSHPVHHKGVRVPARTAADIGVVVVAADVVLAHSGGEHRQVDPLAGVHRQGLDLEVGDRLGDLRLRGFDQRRLSGNGDRFFDGSDPEGEVEARFLADP